MEDTNTTKKRLKLKICGYILLVIVFLWFSFASYEMYRVKNHKKTLICFNEVKDVEDDDEYSKMCYGLFYKYKEYYLKSNDSLTAREFTLFFTEFKRDNQNKEF